MKFFLARMKKEVKSRYVFTIGWHVSIVGQISVSTRVGLLEGD